jgi:hypothetical protein
VGLRPRRALGSWFALWDPPVWAVLVRTSDPCVVSANEGEANPDQLKLFCWSDSVFVCRCYAFVPSISRWNVDRVWTNTGIYGELIMFRSASHVA